MTDGAPQAKITLLGQYIASQFHISSDGLGGSYITDPPPASPITIAAAHG